MVRTVTPEYWDEACKHLARRDRVMRKLIPRLAEGRLQSHGDAFTTLARSVVGQQISVKAAQTVWERLTAAVDGGETDGLHAIAPAAVLALDTQELRGAGLSSQKASYLHDLSAKVAAREVRLDRTARMSDDDVIAELTQVKGIGVWTAQMYLMFSLGRLDVFPHDDLGIRSALRNLYGLKELPDRKTSHRIATPWRPYATIASWYCWRSLEIETLTLPQKDAFPG